MSNPWNTILEEDEAVRWQGCPFPTRALHLTCIDDAEKVFHLMQQIQKETL